MKIIIKNLAYAFIASFCTPLLAELPLTENLVLAQKEVTPSRMIAAYANPSSDSQAYAELLGHLAPILFGDLDESPTSDEFLKLLIQFYAPGTPAYQALSNDRKQLCDFLIFLFSKLK